MEKSRLFVSIALPEEVTQELIRICQYFTKRELFEGRCTRPENLHLTLKFIGSVSDTLVPKIDEILSNVFANEGKATLDGLGVFPHRRRIRILFVDLECTQLHILAKQIEQALFELFEPEVRAFKSHITIARIKKIEDQEKFLREVDRFVVKPISFDITEFTLVQSELTPNGPVYTTVASYPLYSV